MAPPTNKVDANIYLSQAQNDQFKRKDKIIKKSNFSSFLLYFRDK